MVCSRAPCRPPGSSRLLIAALVAVSGCGGGESQDANEPEGTYRLEVADASFPAKQGDRRADDDAHPRAQPGAAHRPERRRDGRDQGRRGRRRRDRVRPEGRRLPPRRRQPARSGSSTRSPSAAPPPTPTPGRSARSRAARPRPSSGSSPRSSPASYSLAYRVAPGLDGKARLAAGSKARGTFAVTRRRRARPRARELQGRGRARRRGRRRQGLRPSRARRSAVVRLRMAAPARLLSRVRRAIGSHRKRVRSEYG